MNYGKRQCQHINVTTFHAYTWVAALKLAVWSSISQCLPPTVPWSMYWKYHWKLTGDDVITNHFQIRGPEASTPNTRDLRWMGKLFQVLFQVHTGALPSYCFLLCCIAGIRGTTSICITICITWQRPAHHPCLAHVQPLCMCTVPRRPPARSDKGHACASGLTSLVTGKPAHRQAGVVWCAHVRPLQPSSKQALAKLEKSECVAPQGGDAMEGGCDSTEGFVKLLQRIALCRWHQPHPQQCPWLALPDSSSPRMWTGSLRV